MREFLDIFDIDTLPDRLLSCRLQIIVLISQDELCLIRMRQRADPCESSNPHLRT